MALSLLQRMERFLEGEDPSLANANAMEALLDELYPEDELVQEYVTLLACYRPGGGPYLYDWAEAAKAGRRVLAHLLARGQAERLRQERA